MSEEKKVIELTDEELEKVSGGTVVTANLFYKCNNCNHSWHALTIQSSAYNEAGSIYFDDDVEKTCPECGNNKCSRYISTDPQGYADICEMLRLSINN